MIINSRLAARTVPRGGEWVCTLIAPLCGAGQTGHVDSDAFPPGFFERADGSADEIFYSWPRLVTHIDDDAIAAVGALYEELGIDRGRARPHELLGVAFSYATGAPHRAGDECRRAAGESRPPKPSSCTTSMQTRNCLSTEASFDAAVCCVSVDYLTRPLEVFAEVVRVLRPGGPFVCTFSNRCFPTKAIRGWLYANDEERCDIVSRYFRSAPGFGDPRQERRTPASHYGDPLLAVWAYRS